ncbi:MAG: transposase [Paludibacter sp.]|jgi:REP element-mobilizing transposase RayT|nr:transposase [Paludibacter sp.]
MNKKEFHRANLPHYQQPGQAYFITWNLQIAIPAKALKESGKKLILIKVSVDFAEKTKQSPEQINALKNEYRFLRKMMLKALDDILDVGNHIDVNLSKTENTSIIVNSLRFWEGKKLKNFAICVMPNHVHWVLELNSSDENGEVVWLDDILKSVKQFSSTQINKSENRLGKLWQKESWDTTIRDNRHLYKAIEYTRNNPVKAGLVKDWRDWPGTLVFE